MLAEKPEGGESFVARISRYGGNLVSIVIVGVILLIAFIIPLLLSGTFSWIF